MLSNGDFSKCGTSYHIRDYNLTGSGNMRFTFWDVQNSSAKSSLLVFVNFSCSINLHTIWDLLTNISLLSPVLNLLLDVDLSLSQALQFGINCLFLFVFVFLFPPSVTTLKLISFPLWSSFFAGLIAWIFEPASYLTFFSWQTFDISSLVDPVSSIVFYAGASSKCQKIWTGRETCYLHKQILR